LIPELFPNAKYILGIMTGSMEHYLKKLRHYAGEVPLVTSEYGSSEGWIASNVNPKVAPELATYVVLPQIAYFEFIPLSQLDGTKVELEPVGLTDVKIGEDYEVVFTNPAGTINSLIAIFFLLTNQNKLSIQSHFNNVSKVYKYNK